jgi:hypothetical protein
MAAAQAQSERLTPGDGAGGWPLCRATALARAPAVQLPDEAPQEILVIAQRQTDAVAYSERGADAPGCHPYFSADHMSAVTQNGIVRL